MTEQEEAVGRQRLEVLAAYQKRLLVYATNRDILHPEGGEHEIAVRDYDKLADMIERLEADPSIPAIHILDAERRVTEITEQLATAQMAMATHAAEAAKTASIDQAAVDKATADLTEAQSALDALKGK